MTKKKLRKKIKLITAANNTRADVIRKLQNDLRVMRTIKDLSERALKSAERALASKEIQLNNAAEHSAKIIGYLNG